MTIVGITRRIDEMGRITIPSEIRRIFSIEKYDMVEIIGTSEGILIRVPDIEIVKKRKNKHPKQHLS